MSQKTNWMGMWNTRPAVYRSKALTQAQIKELPKKCRIILRENKFHRSNNDGTPRFVFCFADAEASDAISFEIEDYSTEIQQLRQTLEDIAHDLDDAISDASIFVDREDIDPYSVWCCLRRIREKIKIDN